MAVKVTTICFRKGHHILEPTTCVVIPGAKHVKGSKQYSNNTDDEHIKKASVTL